MSAFTKLDSGIVNSTIWVQPHDVLRVWIALLALADQGGIARTAAPALAHLCMIPLDRMREILRVLESPDEDSRTDTEGGRRILKIEGGWWLVNHSDYRRKVSAEEKREADRERIASKRSQCRAESQDVADCRVESQPVEVVAEVAQAEAEAEVEKNKSKEQVRSRGSRLRKGWGPTVAEVEWAKAKRSDLDIEKEAELFRDHWLAAAGKGSTKTDWEAAWRTWINKAWPQAKGGTTPKAKSAAHSGFQERAYGAGGDL